MYGSAFLVDASPLFFIDCQLHRCCSGFDQGRCVLVGWRPRGADLALQDTVVCDCTASHPSCRVVLCCVVLQLDYFTSSSRSALRAVFSSWTLDECHAWLSGEVGLQMVLEEETRKYFPASNSGREVRGRRRADCACSAPCWLLVFF